jgi:hypothetical protein
MDHNQTQNHKLWAANNSYTPDNVIQTIESLGAKVIFVDADVSRTIPTGMLHYLVADEVHVEVFVIRNPDERLSERDHAAVRHWMDSPNLKRIHVIKDHPKHSNFTIIDGLWGAKAKYMRSKLRDISMRKALQNYMTENKITESDADVAGEFLRSFLYPKLKRHIVYYDSINCDKLHSVPHPLKRLKPNYVGQKYDHHEQPLIRETFLTLASWNPNCEIAY